jgi:hypothetical protein
MNEGVSGETKANLIQDFRHKDAQAIIGFITPRVLAAHRAKPRAAADAAE